MKIEAEVDDLFSAVRAAAKDAGLPDSSVRLYIFLCEACGTEVKNFYEELCERTGKSKPTILSAVRALVRAGHVRKERRLGGRTYKIVLTGGKKP